MNHDAPTIVALLISVEIGCDCVGGALPEVNRVMIKFGAR